MTEKFTVWSSATMKTPSSASEKMARCVFIFLKTHHGGQNVNRSHNYILLKIYLNVAVK